jgi:hypothetical protein
MQRNKMRFLKHIPNPFHKQEQELKKARDSEIIRRREEGLSDDEIISCLMAMPETEKFIEEAVKHNPVPGGSNFMRSQLTAKLREGFTTTVKNG